MSNLKIICDSLSDVNKEYLEEYDIDVVPLTLILNEKEYRDGVDIDPDEFYKILRNENVYPKTSQATYAQFKEIFDKYTKEGKKIIYISGSSAATGTCQSAIMAKNDTEGEIYINDKRRKNNRRNTKCTRGIKRKMYPNVFSRYFRISSKRWKNIFY